MYKLVIQDDEGKTTVVPLIRDEITIGRKEGNTIRLTERNVSRKHARIVRSNGTVAIEDLGSYNGVRVNGTRISQRTPLTVSDRVQIGDYLIELKAEGAEQGVGAPQSYEDAKTQPVERVDPGYAARTTAPLHGGAGMPPPHPGAAAAGSAGTMPTPPAGVMPGGAAMGDPASALSDTDPRMAGTPRAAAVAPMSSTSGHARLVILSSNFAGREFELSKPQVVIGRTDDNDVVVNHRSISRNHAKVVREPETGRYTIMDLQSSNGVRVNGEEYGKVELRRGDIVDLGHVRMRFVDVGEDFLFGRDAQAVDVPTGGGKGLFIALGALLVIGGIVGVVMATSGGDGGSGKSEPAAVAGEKIDAGKQMVVETGPDAATAVMTENKKLNELRTTAAAHLEKEDWQALFDACKKILEIVPDDPDCEQKLVLVKREQGAQLKFDDFHKAVQTKSYPGVAKHFREIDGESIYKERARSDHDRMRDEYVASVRGQAQRYAKAGKCKDIDRLAGNADGNWQEAGDAAREEGASCEAVVAVGPDKKDDKKDVKKDVKKDDTKKDDGGSSATSNKSAQELADEASAAARAGQYGKALRVAEEALKKEPGNQSALTTAAIAACNLKQGDKAKKYINKLSGQRQGMVRQVCLRNNVSVD